jgi:16S rRNA (cytosine967-C5)-methyltransferase
VKSAGREDGFGLAQAVRGADVGAMNPSSNADLSHTPWSHAARLVARWVEKAERVDALLDTIPRSVSGVDRGRCQNLFLGSVRHRGRIEAHLKDLITLPPRPRVQGILLVAGFELIEGGDEHHAARVGHHAVEQTKVLASPSEARLVNAVVRKLAAGLAAERVPAKEAGAEQLAEYFSHPGWMVKRWLAQFGADATRSLLEWNQRPAPLYARWRNRERALSGDEVKWLTPTQWNGFYEIKAGHWPQVEAALAAGLIYLQDPATRLAVEMLAPVTGETVLDVCAAPGGKSLAIADALSGSGRVIAVDLPGTRVERLKENLARVSGVETKLIQADLSADGARIFEADDLPKEYAAVLIDVPCSNTGVMRHRADVKWRLQVGDFAKHARQQLGLLSAASDVVAPGGRVVYSTCSLDEDENEEVVQAFLKKTGGRFVLEKSVISKPWESGHDGAAAFLLRRVG